MKMETSTQRANIEPTGLTAYVADFITSTKYSDIPKNVVQLGKKSILDGFGLALAGSVAKSGDLVRRHLQSLGCTGTTSVIGSTLRVRALPPSRTESPFMQTIMMIRSWQ